MANGQDLGGPELCGVKLSQTGGLRLGTSLAKMSSSREGAKKGGTDGSGNRPTERRTDRPTDGETDRQMARAPPPVPLQGKGGANLHMKRDKFPATTTTSATTTTTITTTTTTTDFNFFRML